MSLNMHLNANNYSNIFSTDQLISMQTFDAMYEDDHNQIEHFIPIVNSQEDLPPIMNENINIENELHNHHHNHHDFDNDSSDATTPHIDHHININNIINTTSLTKNISNLNQILSLTSTSFDDFNANNENLLSSHHHQNIPPYAIKMEKLNFNLANNNNNNHLKSKVCDLINLNKISLSNSINQNASNFTHNDNDDDDDHNNTNKRNSHHHHHHQQQNSINSKIKDSSFGKQEF